MARTKREAQPASATIDPVYMAVDQIRPYWRNPRRIPESAVEAVVESITKYGYRQPIVIDQEGVIIAGHTRFAAVRRMGWETVPVLVADLDEKAAREYRLLDNRSNELSNWDNDSLLLELREFADPQVAASWFPEVDLTSGFGWDSNPVGDDDTDDAEESIKQPPAPKPVETVTLLCPNCLQPYDMERTTLAAKLADGRPTGVEHDPVPEPAEA